MPDIASKKASVMLRLSCEKANGRAAKAVSTTQLIVDKIKAWRTERDAPPARLVRDSETPINNVTPEETAKTCQSGLPEIMSAIAGTNIINANVVNKMPKIRNMGRKSITSNGPQVLIALRYDAPSKRDWPIDFVTNAFLSLAFY
jgi:hypothetical protein